MIKSLVRTLKGPSRDPRMAYICRPMPRDLPDEQVIAALEIALTANPNPDDLVETLPLALRQVTGRTFSVLDRSTGDVTGAFRRSQVMIRDGEVGLWPGYAARAYPLLAPSKTSEKTRAAIIAADATGADDAASPTDPAGKPGWAPPPPVDRSDERAQLGRQNVPRDQWLEMGAECPRCGERINEAMVYSWRPVPDDPKLLLLYCPDCGDRVEINHV